MEKVRLVVPFRLAELAIDVSDEGRRSIHDLLVGHGLANKDLGTGYGWTEPAPGGRELGARNFKFQRCTVVVSCVFSQSISEDVDSKQV